MTGAEWSALLVTDRDLCDPESLTPPESSHSVRLPPTCQASIVSVVFCNSGGCNDGDKAVNGDTAGDS